MQLTDWSSAGVSPSIKAGSLAVCWSGAFRCVLTQCQGGKTPAVGSIIRSLPHNLEPIIPKPSRQLPVFSGVKILASLTQSQAVRRSDKLRKTPKIHPRLYKPKVVCSMLTIMTAPLKKDWTSMVCLVRMSIITQTYHTNCQVQWWRGDDMGLCYSHRTWAPCSHCVNN